MNDSLISSYYEQMDEDYHWNNKIEEETYNMVLYYTNVTEYLNFILSEMLKEEEVNKDYYYLKKMLDKYNNRKVEQIEIWRRLNG